MNAKVSSLNSNNNELQKLYRVSYFEPGQVAVHEAADEDLYFYTVYTGQQSIELEKGDCAYYLSDCQSMALLQRGPCRIDSVHVATVIRGYMPENKSSSITRWTSLPYVNGCSTKQIFPPDRIGDPTLQMLSMPPYSAEQAHHIHSTARVAYVLSGSGRSVVGMEGQLVVENLYPGKTVVLEKMCPHHFETDGEHLVVIPLHVYSSVGPIENNHPMFNGTHMT